ncbi:putative glycosyl transferase [Candidatus Ornithobacterium hominis]|uniref:glycosyltransferase n=1 Tax=Candidatus Ornithobacterium hominis TaxID=2497989 RepID=UPI000E5AB8A9|nr:glycosyltransferase [Candidatus Ornithobacterium hominis]SZD72070.1 putative glycosyl transferase [Candidatus Ornithobacterium hominis]
MNNKKNILFITWDGPQTSYMEGLFMPIFHEIQKIDTRFQFHCLQFIPTDNTQNQQIASKQFNIPYASAHIQRKPIATLGSFWALFNGHKEIKKYIKKWDIDILMPRSLFPAFMVNQLKSDIPIIFDADGLPIEERIDFAGLKRNSLSHKFLQNIEKNIIQKADYVMTRSNKSIAYHLEHYHLKNQNKFYRVLNGRDTNQFNVDKRIRQEYRKKLNVTDDTKVFVYAGSFGPQYGGTEMIEIFKAYEKNQPTHFIFLTGSPEKVKPLIPENLKEKFTVHRVPFEEVAKYMNAADVAFAIRQPTLSMQGVFPIKLGEYLLAGLPTIASKGIGDSEEILKEIPEIYLYDHKNIPPLEEIINFVNQNNITKQEIRNYALQYFSLEAAAESYLRVLNKMI